MSFIWPPLLLSVLLVPIGVLLYRTIEQRRRRTINLVGLGAGAGTASPPLRGVQSWSVVAAGLAAFAVAGLALVWAFARTAFRAPVPGRIGGGA